MSDRIAGIPLVYYNNAATVLKFVEVIQGSISTLTPLIKVRM
jgi:hypothetical protein